MQVSLQALKAFESAARRGSFKLAAEELSLTPTAISHHISNLESRLNVDLFYRQARRITLTEAGAKLAKATSDGFRMIESALEEMRMAGKVVRVASTSSLAALVLIPAQHEFSQNHPELSMEITTGEALESQSYLMPVRLGDSRAVAPSDIIRAESFDVFGAHSMKPPVWSTEPVTIFTTKWKNRALPEPPLDAWLAANGLDTSNIVLKTFDQELFGIQQAMAGNGFVFCSTTLTQGLLKADLLQQFGTQPVASDLCYYVPNKHSYDTRNAHALLCWLDNVLNQ
ncbi:LysR family transcriptional regulator [Alkalimonas sp. NCh-2]|uniref:LysR family transcriptional regulator n=1 Tax=Alkalimonas sp. NCh-2 TaxID=3144846 RepID=UPI0031F63951